MTAPAQPEWHDGINCASMIFQSAEEVMCQALRLFGILLIHSVCCQGGGQSLRSLTTAARYLDSLSMLESPAHFTSPLLGYRSVYVFECLSAIFKKPMANVSNTSMYACSEATRSSTARTMLQRACVASDAFSFNHQIELLLMLRSELLNGPMSWTVVCDLGGGDKSQSESEAMRLITGMQGESELSAHQSSFISKVSPIVRHFFGAEASLAVVGSSACGLASAHSDLDLTILLGCVASRPLRRHEPTLHKHGTPPMTLLFYFFSG